MVMMEVKGIAQNGNGLLLFQNLLKGFWGDGQRTVGGIRRQQNHQFCCGKCHIGFREAAADGLNQVIQGKAGAAFRTQF